MKTTPVPRAIHILLVLLGAWQTTTNVYASNLDTVGFTLLRTMTTNVDGAGIRVAQPEAGYDQGTNWEVNPNAVGQPMSLFTYISAGGSTTNFPNSLSSESSHADNVANNFYGIQTGTATNVAHVDNYDANYFIQISEKITPYATNYTALLPSSNIDDPVVNQSFVWTGATTAIQQAIDSAYDNYAAQYNTLFVSGAGNGIASGNAGRVNPPATSYNGIGVGVSDGSSSIGPTIDNGRCKPDIIAPGEETSYSTPYVAGAAALLMQAGLRGDGGSDTNSTADIRVVKTLLLNGAIKPTDWTNDAPSPFDYRYGAGVLNVFNSYEQLAGGKHTFIISNSVPTGDPHPPTNAAGTESVLSGWDFNLISSSSSYRSTNDGVNHYYFNVTNGVDNAAFTATITLVWNRQRNETNINNLDLFLYNAISSNLIAASTSVVDNVEHIWLPRLPQGRYDLQVLKNAGNSVSDAETYALAFEFFSQSLNISPSGTSTMLSWPVYPAGFFVEATTNLTASINWETGDIPASAVTNNQNYIRLNATNAVKFFRLRRP